jgi:hypothetical protein
VVQSSRRRLKKSDVVAHDVVAAAVFVVSNPTVEESLSGFGSVETVSIVAVLSMWIPAPMQLAT